MSFLAESLDFVANVGMVADRQGAPTVQHGLIVDGSFDPTLGTVKVRFGADMLETDVDGNLLPVDQLPARGPYPLLTPFIGQQGAPTGGERCIAIPADGSWVVAITHWDDSPGILAGEWIARHPRFTQSHFHLKNDGSSVHSAETMAIVTGPQVLLGEMTPIPGDSVVRQSDLQQAVNDVLSVVSRALEQLAQQVQPGSGVPAPSIAGVTATGSDISHSA